MLVILEFVKANKIVIYVLRNKALIKKIPRREVWFLLEILSGTLLARRDAGF